MCLKVCQKEQLMGCFALSDCGPQTVTVLQRAYDLVAVRVEFSFDQAARIQLFADLDVYFLVGQKGLDGRVHAKHELPELMVTLGVCYLSPGFFCC